MSFDGGKTWVEASRYQKIGIPYVSEDASSDKWAWVLFEATADVQSNTEIVAKAVCETYLILIIKSIFCNAFSLAYIQGSQFAHNEMLSS